MEKYILLHHKAAERFGGALRGYGFTPVPLVPDTRLNAIVAAHADTLLCDGAANVPIVNDVYAGTLPPHIRELLLVTPDGPSGDYPTDTAFNALALGRYLFARRESLAHTVRAAAISTNLTLVNVNQGYAKCSVLALPSRAAAITADAGMAQAMESRNLPVLRISPGAIALEGCAFGFIGGAAFADDPLCCCSLHAKPAVYFFGDLARHPDGSRIAAFIESRGYDIVSLGGDLTDYGGAVVLRG